MLVIRRRRSLPKIIAIVVLLVIISGACTVLLFLPRSAESSLARQQPNSSAIAASSKETIYGQPTRLKIPKINVDAVVDSMTMLPDGSMQAPSGPTNVGWFKLGPHPGEAGSAVIDGHYGRWKDGESSVFDNLNKLGKGDVMYVIDDKGQSIAFVVRESRMFGKDQDASSVFRVTDGKAHLNLITCQGTWKQDQKTYSERLIVFADKKT